MWELHSVKLSMKGGRKDLSELSEIGNVVWKRDMVNERTVGKTEAAGKTLCGFKLIEKSISQELKICWVWKKLKID